MKHIRPWVTIVLRFTVTDRRAPLMFGSLMSMMPLLWLTNLSAVSRLISLCGMSGRKF